MRRLVVVVAAMGLLAIGSASAALAAPIGAENEWQPTWACPGWGGAFGTYDPAANPNLKRMADTLQMSAADLVKELQAGKSVADVASAKGVALSAVVQVLQAPQNEILDLRVQYGYITKDQADQMKQFMSDRLTYQLQQKGAYGLGFRGGMMGPAYGTNVAPGFGTNVAPGFGPGMMGPGFRGGMMGPGFRGGSGWAPRTSAS